MTRQYSNLSSNTMQYDEDGRVARRTWGDGFFVTYEYDTAGAVTTIRENGGFVLASFGYDDLGRRTRLARGNGTVTGYAHDGLSRLTQLTQDLAGGGQDLSLSFGYNPAGQIATRTSSNGAYGFSGGYDVARRYSVNGLNQYLTAGATAFGYDARGNLVRSGDTGYGYNSRNEMISGPGVQLAYRNPAGLLNHLIRSDGSVTNFDYVGADLATEFENNQVVRRYVHGPGTDEPLVWYEGAGTGDRRWLHADERGSAIAATDGSGAATAINTYDEHGIPGSGYRGRFQYTGQKWIAELGMYDYKARMYSPTLGRFMQTDSIGYGDGMNWYDYVGGDPINATDPSGLICDSDACVSGSRSSFGGFGGFFFPGFFGGGGGASFQREDIYSPLEDDVVVTATRPKPQRYRLGSQIRLPQNNQNNCPRGSVLVKLSALPTTLAGLAYGSLAGLLSKGPVSVSVGNNAIQISSIDGLIGNRPVTIGNVQLYGVGDGPGSSRRSYDGQISNIGRHEQGHTYQAEAMGNGCLGNMLAAGAVEWLTGEKNPYETEADKFARSGCR